MAPTLGDERFGKPNDSHRLDFGEEFHVWNASEEIAEEDESVVHF